MVDGSEPNDGLPPRAVAGGPEIKIFLIADVRGYTRFTQQRGDEAAAELAEKFARLARAGVEARGGSVLELRGDEALAVFGSPRDALRAAVVLQTSFVDQTIEVPSLPLRVGIGIDAGEAAPVEEGFRGGALNLAARLCALARGGEILASQEVVHLARKVDGIRYVEGAQVRVKGMTDPIRPVRVLPETDDPVERLRQIPVPSGSPGESSRRRRVMTTLVVAVVVVAAAVSIVIALSDHHRAQVVRSPQPTGLVSRLARIDSVTNASRTFTVPGDASAVAAGGGSVWVASRDRNVVTQLDARTLQVQHTIPVGDRPVALAFETHPTGGALWVSSTNAGTVSRIDPVSGKVVKTIAVGDGVGDLAVGAGAVWVVNPTRSTVSRIDPLTNKLTATAPVPHIRSIAAGAGSVWVVTSFTRAKSSGIPGNGCICTLATVRAIDPTTAQAGSEHLMWDTTSAPPGGIALNGDSVWVTFKADGSVVGYDPETDKLTEIPVASGPSLVASGPGFDLWAAAGTALWKVSTSSRGVVASVSVSPREPIGIAVGESAIWALLGPV